jgi:hypothetical protein
MSDPKHKGGTQMVLKHDFQTLSEGGGYVFVTYTATPKDAARTSSVREAVRRRAMVAYHEKGGRYATSEQHGHCQLDGKARMHRNMTKFKLDRTSSLQIPNSASREAAQPAPLEQPLNHHLPALDPYVTELGPGAWELLHFCTAYQSSKMSVPER